MSRLRSMTGHGLGTATLGSGRVEVEIRSVNHRSFEARSRLPTELADHTGLVEDVARRRLGRGRIEILVRIEGFDAGALTLDVARARAAFEELTALRDALAPREAIPLSLLGAVPGLFSPRALDLRSARTALTAATDAACAATEEMRIHEGRRLGADMSARLAHVITLLGSVESRSPAAVDHVRRRLTERVQKALAANVELDPGRLEHEIVLFADRSDVAEECTRLRCHADQMEAALLGDGEITSGRRLDFLLQEMQREVNTIGQKCADLDIARAVIDMKLAVEQMREQVQNVM